MRLLNLPTKNKLKMTGDRKIIKFRYNNEEYQIEHSMHSTERHKYDSYRKIVPSWYIDSLIIKQVKSYLDGPEKEGILQITNSTPYVSEERNEYGVMILIDFNREKRRGKIVTIMVKPWDTPLFYRDHTKLEEGG